MQCRSDNEPYLIVDCGGGTIDLVMHARCVDARSHTVSLREVAPGDGALAGGAFIDEEFLMYVANTVGARVWEDFKASKVYQAQLLKLRDNWTRLKFAFTGEEETAALEVSLPAFLRKALKGQEVEELLLHPQDVKNMFNRSVAKIIDVVEKFLQQPAAASCRKVFLVGGLGASSYVARRLKEELPSPFQLILPPKPAEAILVGAALMVRIQYSCSLC